MNILFIGSGAGSWTIRGEQLGAALGARVTERPTGTDLGWADVVVLVKRAWQAWRPGLTKAAVVWDALDFWAQPGQNTYDERAARGMFSGVIRQIQPAMTIGATRAMADAAGGVYLPHHAWPGLQPTPARREVKTVAYQGNAAYLGRWAGWLDEACRARGWSFVINPTRLSDADILVAFRDGIWDGWMCREWKSGVKFANAIAAGRPIISQPCAARSEMLPPGAAVETLDDLNDALDYCADYERRDAVSWASEQQSTWFRLESVAERYRVILEAVACPA